MDLFDSARVKGAWMAFSPELDPATREAAERNGLFKRQTRFSLGMEPDDCFGSFGSACGSQI